MFCVNDGIESLNNSLETFEAVLRRSNVVEVDARNRMLEVSRGLKVLVSI